jgi:phosphoribosylglycinamide formyltransferase 1
VDEKLTKLAVLVSGKGTIMEAMLKSGLNVALVLADRPCRGLEIAKEFGVPTELVRRTSFGPDFDREAYTAQAMNVLQQHGIDLIALSGFMTIFSPSIFDRYEGKILNTHPSLLPAFKGKSPVPDALEYGVKVAGCTVHIVTPELDGGPILAQAAVPVEEGDTVETLHERIKVAERRLYPETIRKLMAKASLV